MKVPTRGPTKFPVNRLAVPPTLVLEAPAEMPVLFYFMGSRITLIYQLMH